VVEGGFTYKREFIPLDDVNEVERKRAQGYQRKSRGHIIDQMM